MIFVVIESFVIIVSYSSQVLFFFVPFLFFNHGLVFSIVSSFSYFISAVSLPFNLFYFVDLFVVGLFYRMTYRSHINALGFELTHNVVNFYFLDSLVFVNVRANKRYFTLYSVNNDSLMQVVESIMRFQIPDVYNGNGISLVSLPITLNKIVKNR